MFRENFARSAFSTRQGTRVAGAASLLASRLVAWARPSQRVRPSPDPIAWGHGVAGIAHPCRPLRIRMRFVRHISLETSAMTITAAHIPAIVALIAGILILIMPRLLNIVVAIYLICIGLIGLGALRFLHL
jgi:hypothetical protein